ncbi:MAG: hypothetical protein WC734_03885 [Patescibacteria group bacterium]|jgi:hypothetical protein
MSAHKRLLLAISIIVVVISAIAALGWLIFLNPMRYYNKYAGPLGTTPTTGWVTYHYPSTATTTSPAYFSLQMPTTWSFNNEAPDGFISFVSGENKLSLNVSKLADDSVSNKQFTINPKRFLIRTTPEFFTPTTKQTFTVDEMARNNMFLVRSYRDQKLDIITAHLNKDDSYYTATALITQTNDPGLFCGKIESTTCEFLLTTVLSTIVFE